MQANTTSNVTTTTSGVATLADTPANLAREHYGCKGPALMAKLKADGFTGRTLAERAAAWHTARNTATVPAVEPADVATLPLPTDVPAAAPTTTLPTTLPTDVPATTSEPTDVPAAAPTCNVCGVSMGWDAPSGVCGVVCLNSGQGFTSEPARASDVIPHIEREREQLAAAVDAMRTADMPTDEPVPSTPTTPTTTPEPAATAPTVPPGLKLPTRADVQPTRRPSVFSRIRGAVSGAVDHLASAGRNALGAGAVGAAALLTVCAMCGLGAVASTVAGSLR